METKDNSANVPAVCLQFKDQIEDEGRFLEAPEARDLLNNYLSGVRDETGEEHNYGFLFGMKNLTKLMDWISGYNDTKTGDDRILGLRVYLCRTSPIPSDVKVPADKVIDNLILMPVLGSGFDLYKVQPNLVPDAIVGHPRPCPNECFVLTFLGV